MTITNDEKSRTASGSGRANLRLVVDNARGTTALAAPSPSLAASRPVPVDVSVDTVEMLQELLGEARKGKLIGLAFAALAADRQYVVGYTGECRTSPTHAKGMVIDLLDDLMCATRDRG